MKPILGQNLVSTNSLFTPTKMECQVYVPLLSGLRPIGLPLAFGRLRAKIEIPIFLKLAFNPITSRSLTQK